MMSILVCCSFLFWHGTDGATPWLSKQVAKLQLSYTVLAQVTGGMGCRLRQPGGRCEVSTVDERGQFIAVNYDKMQKLGQIQIKFAKFSSREHTRQSQTQVARSSKGSTCTIQ